MLKNSPFQYYVTLHPKRIEDVFNSPTCSIAKLRVEAGELKVKALLVYVISDFIEQFNVGKTMNDKQIGRATELILDEFHFLKPDDFKLCFDNALKGHYGASYDRIDAQVICSWLNQYVQERMNTADHLSYQEHISQKSQIIEISPAIYERISNLKPDSNVRKI